MSFISNLFAGNKLASRESDAASSSQTKVYPFYMKATVILFGLVLFFYVLLLLRDVLVPLCFAALIAVLLNPLVNRMLKWGVPKIIAILLSLLLGTAIIIGVALFISSQVAQFTELAPQLKERSAEMFATVQHWIQDTFHLSIQKQNNLINDAAQGSKAYAGKTVGTVLTIVGVVVLLPIYIFLMLYYKLLFLNFFYEVFETGYEKKVAEILNETKGAIQSYIVGLLIEAVVVAALNSTALLLLGVRYAILLGIIGALLNIIPYIGGLIAITLPVLMSLLTGDGGFTIPLLVIGSYALIQFIDNNILVPRIVSSKVDVNALVTIVIVLLGGTIWGVAGMFLAVPFIAVCKIIFDRVDGLKPWGKLLGVKIGLPRVRNTTTAEQGTE